MLPRKLSYLLDPVKKAAIKKHKAHISKTIDELLTVTYICKRSITNQPFLLTLFN